MCMESSLRFAYLRGHNLEYPKGIRFTAHDERIKQKDNFSKLFVAIGILRLPPPRIHTHRINIPLSLPEQLLFRF